jgi:probable lipoprotein NlpC
MNNRQEMTIYKKKLINVFVLGILFLMSGCKTQIDTAIATAKTYLGVAYEYGGDSQQGIDCSALIQKSFKSAGYSLPRTAAQQSSKGKSVELNAVKKGDLLFFGEKNAITHVGMVVDGMGEDCTFIHASGIDGKVLISKLSNSGRRESFVKARRYF